MDLILISEEKLKIILTENDLQEMNIDIERLDYSNVSTKRVFWEILDRAKETAGFDAAKSKLYVQVFPSSDGGCEMFVTKFSSSPIPCSSIRKKVYRMSKNAEDKSGVLVVLGFDDLYKLCCRLSEEKLYLKTSLFYDDLGFYIMVIKKNMRIPSYISPKCSLISKIPEYLCEYGKVMELTERAIAYIHEHCEKIADGNATELIASI